MGAGTRQENPRTIPDPHLCGGHGQAQRGLLQQRRRQAVHHVGGQPGRQRGPDLPRLLAAHEHTHTHTPSKCASVRLLHRRTRPLHARRTTPRGRRQLSTQASRLLDFSATGQACAPCPRAGALRTAPAPPPDLVVRAPNPCTPLTGNAPRHGPGRGRQPAALLTRVGGTAAAATRPGGGRESRPWRHQRPTGPCTRRTSAPRCPSRGRPAGCQ